MTILKHTFFAIPKMVQKTLSQHIKKLIFGLKKKDNFWAEIMFFPHFRSQCKMQTTRKSLLNQHLM